MGEDTPSTSKSDETTTNVVRVAVVGGGVSGMCAAWHLLNLNDCSSASSSSTVYKVTVLESEGRLGGHACTIQVPVKTENGMSSSLDVDVGFMVFNEENYPNLVPWFRELRGVSTENSDMSLSVSLDGGETMEWSSVAVFADWRNIFRPQFYGFLWDMLRFNREAGSVLRQGGAKHESTSLMTTGDYLRLHGYNDGFCQSYLLPMMAALWSASMEDVLAFPITQLVGFLCNHRLLQIFGGVQWLTVAGRSRTYTEAMEYYVRGHRHGVLHLSTPVVGMDPVKEDDGNVVRYRLRTPLTSKKEGYVEGLFDHVVFACRPPVARDICRDAVVSVQGKDDAHNLLDALGAVHYADNVIYVHSDPALMPRRRAAWASWNCIGRSDAIRSALRRWDSAAAAANEKEANGKKDEETPTTTTTTNDGDGNVNEDRMKAVYVTYYLNRLQNLDVTDGTDVFVSLNPHIRPRPEVTYRKLVLGHPQFTPRTLEARARLASKHQGRHGLWFVGAWEGYGFHEDGCRSGFQAASRLSGNTYLPWAPKKDDGSGPTVLPPPDLSSPKVTKMTAFWYSAASLGAVGILTYAFTSINRRN